MKVQYFPDTDTLYIELIDVPSEESEEIIEGVVFDYDKEGKVVGIEIEHFSLKGSEESLQKYLLSSYRLIHNL